MFFILSMSSGLIYEAFGVSSMSVNTVKVTGVENLDRLELDDNLLLSCLPICFRDVLLSSTFCDASLKSSIFLCESVPMVSSFRKYFLVDTLLAFVIGCFVKYFVAVVVVADVGVDGGGVGIFVVRLNDILDFDVVVVVVVAATIILAELVCDVRDVVREICDVMVSCLDVGYEVVSKCSDTVEPADVTAAVRSTVVKFNN